MILDWTIILSFHIIIWYCFFGTTGMWMTIKKHKGKKFRLKSRIETYPFTTQCKSITTIGCDLWLMLYYWFFLLHFQVLICMWYSIRYQNDGCNFERQAYVYTVAYFIFFFSFFLFNFGKVDHFWKKNTWWMGRNYGRSVIWSFFLFSV